MSGTDENDFVKPNETKLSISTESIELPPTVNKTETNNRPVSNDKSNWVQFDGDDEQNTKDSKQSTSRDKVIASTPIKAVSDQPPVLRTESVHIDERKTTPSDTKLADNNKLKTSTPAVLDVSSSVNRSLSTSISIPTPNEQGLRTIELTSGARIRQGFVNGDVIVTLLPVNTKWPWVTPAVFRPELVPEELMAEGLTLTVEEYVQAMETLVNDFRFTLYNVCYKRILVVWILFAFLVLMAMLFSGLNGIVLFSIGIVWLFLNAAAIFLCMWLKLRMARGLERCLASVNKQLIRHKIIMALDDRGKISCHKVNLCFIYYDPEQCVNFLNDFLVRCEQNGNAIQPGWESRLDVDVSDIVIQGSTTTRVSRKQAMGTQIFLRYLQRWGKDYLRRRLDWIFEENGMHEMPRHLQSSICPCQYAEEVILNKPRRDRRACCPTCNDWLNSHGISERALLIFVRYASRWANQVVRGLSDVSSLEPGRHCAHVLCPCQYIERHLKCKPQGFCCSCCLTMTDPIYRDNIYPF